MCDLAYVNLLREKVRQKEAEENHLAAGGSSSQSRFVPWTFGLQPPSPVASGRDRPGTSR
jgi:hypothetical protein